MNSYRIDPCRVKEFVIVLSLTDNRSVGAFSALRKIILC